IVSVAYGKPAMAVDTHVFRVAERIGLTTGSKNPLQTERALVAHIPRELLGTAHHWLILHGRYVCTARAPKCETCGIAPWCRYRQRELKKAASSPAKRAREQEA
ncbi:MAG: endonuclease III, partial [Rikenellaceae bacterium]|nr:endonuclease III [Rikenellaceae bacterium]